MLVASSPPHHRTSRQPTRALSSTRMFRARLLPLVIALVAILIAPKAQAIAEPHLYSPSPLGRAATSSPIRAQAFLGRARIGGRQPAKPAGWGHPRGFQETYDYETTGELKALTDRLGRISAWTHDQLARTTNMFDTAGRHHAHSYTTSTRSPIQARASVRPRRHLPQRRSPRKPTRSFFP